MDHAMLVNDGNARSSSLEPTANNASDWPEEDRTKDKVQDVVILVLALYLSLIFPWDAFWIGRVLAEAVGDPWVRLEVLLQPVNVFVFLLLCGNRWLSHFKDLIALSGQLPHLLVMVVVEGGFAEPHVVRGIELTWHASFALSINKVLGRVY